MMMSNKNLSIDKNEMEKLINICHLNLKNSNECLEYLKQKRGFSDIEIEKYCLGYFPRNTDILSKHISSQFLNDNLIVKYNGYSKFADRYYLIIPIYNDYGEPIAIMGRTLLSDSDRSAIGIPKYENSSYKKSSTLYGLYQARSFILKEKNVFVVEGNFDTISMDSNGIHNVVGICGAAFSRAHLYKLARYTDQITFLLDSDDAGQRSMDAIYKKFSNKGIKLRFCKLPDGYKDVDEYFKSGKSREDFFAEIKQHLPLW